ncbi:ANTAR domain-containing protein [Solicola sp. PLA-1-18]|uniref:ANTAR domain-containing protein n=1 Tax=Solicola sp. PLA-1-18 TaxID=3380532 RepID=UPI003B7C5CAE
MADAPRERDVELLSQLAEQLARLDPRRPHPWRLCQAMATVLGADGAALTLSYLSTHRMVAGASDEVVSAVVDLEEVVGRGPGVDAAATGEVVSCTVGAVEEPRWPDFVLAARERLGPLHLLLVPVRPVSRIDGVATFYRRASGLDVLADEARFLGNAVGVALADVADTPAPVDAGAPWRSRAVVHQATGMVMGQVGVSPDDAVALLRAHAYATSTTMDAVARSVVDRRINFSDYRVEGD